MHNVNDKNVQEKLQVLNDYIQRTIDVLSELSNSTRQVALTLGSGVVNRGTIPGVQGGGFAHTSFVQGLPQQILGQQMIPQQILGQQVVPQQILPQQLGLGGVVPQIQQAFVPGVGIVGLMHTPYGLVPVTQQGVVDPQLLALQQQRTGVQVGQVQGQVWPQVGFGLNHSSYVPMHNTVMGLPVTVGMPQVPGITHVPVSSVGI